MCALRRKLSLVSFAILLLFYICLQLFASYNLNKTNFGMIVDDTFWDKGNKEDKEDKEDIVVPEYTSDTFQGCDEMKVNYKFGRQRFENQRIACLVLSLFPRNKILMQLVGETYGKHCDGLYFILDNSDTQHIFNKTLLKQWNDINTSPDSKLREENDRIINEDINDLYHGSKYFGGEIIKLNLSRKSHYKLRNTWEKVHRMFVYFYIYHLNEYDWFARIDDDVLVSIINLRQYLSYFDSNDNNTYYIGHTLFDRWQYDNIVYNAGNLVIINSKTLSKLGPLLLTLPTLPKNALNPGCIDFLAGNDDPALGQCLNALSIYPLSSLDYDLKLRFMTFRNSDHYIIPKINYNDDGIQDSWYWKYQPNDMKALNKCCNIFAINEHRYSGFKGQLKMRQELLELSRSKWNNKTYLNQLKSQLSINEIIPPFPCSFMFNLNNKFKIDKYYNIESDKIRPGQRLSFGNKDILNCHNCNIGDKNDVFWNNEWDRTKLMFKINDSNKLKFYQISKYFPNQLISTQFDIDNETNKFISSKEGDDAERLQFLIDQALDPTISDILVPF